jgi:hypothetical protein
LNISKTGSVSSGSIYDEEVLTDRTLLFAPSEPTPGPTTLQDDKAQQSKAAQRIPFFMPLLNTNN